MSSRSKRRKTARIVSGLLNDIRNNFLETESDNNTKRVIGLLEAPSNVEVIPTSINTSKDFVNTDISESESSSESSSESPNESSSESPNESSNESSNEFSCDNVEISLAKKLALWTCNYQISHVAVDNLLKILQPHVTSEIPLCARTLLTTPRSIVVDTIIDGEFFYFGIESHVKSRITSGLKPTNCPYFKENADVNFVSLSVGCDGIPICKSSNSQLWPLMGVVDQSVCQEPFLIAIYSGKTKPKSIKEYLCKFIEEVKILIAAGITVESVNYKFCISYFAADSPARSFLKCIKPHNSYFSCEKCEQEGTWFLNRVTYPDVSSNLRTKNSFVHQMQEEHHAGQSPLTELPLDLVSQFPLDFMHLVCLGVMRKLLLTWIKGSLKVRLRARDVEIISEKLLSLVAFTPVEFARKPRSLRDVDRFKATEFRSFLLYYGIICLKETLPETLYNHFLKFSAAIFILVSPKAHVNTFNSIANRLLLEFVTDANVLYGQEFMTYNVHSLIHLADDALNFSSLDSFSAFEFENYMQSLKRMVKSKKHFLQQIVNRVSEIGAVKCNSNISTKSGFVTKSKMKKYYLNGILLSVNESDSCFITTDRKIIKLISLVNAEKGLLECKYFLNTAGLTSYPVDSTKFSIFECSKLSNPITISTKNLKNKCALFPVPNAREKYVNIPLTIDVPDSI